MSARVYSTAKRSTDVLQPRRRMRAADVPEALSWVDASPFHGFSLLIKEWHWWPDEREAMVADRPVGTNHEVLCRVAALVHGLCDKDEVAVPGWVFDYTSTEPLTLAAMLPNEGPLWERMLAEACDACRYHNVWFSWRDIESLPEAARRIKSQRRQRRWLSGRLRR